MNIAVKERKKDDLSTNTDTVIFNEGTIEQNFLSNEDIYSMGMKLLRDFMGIVNAETFISLVRNDNYDYTEWRRDFYDKMAPDEYFTNVAEFIKINPYKGNKSTVI